MKAQLRPTIWLDRDGSPLDELRAGVERMVNLHCETPQKQVAMCRVFICRQLQRIHKHRLRFQFRRVFRENTLTQLGLWQAAHVQLTGRIYEPDDKAIEELAALCNQSIKETS